MSRSVAMTPETIAGALNDEQAKFLNEVCADKVGPCWRHVDSQNRQAVRRANLAAFCGNPKRWQPTSLGVLVNRLIAGCHA